MIINPYAFGGGGGGGGYDSLVIAAAPRVWWKLEETSGTNAVDSGAAGLDGTLSGGATFATAGIAPASGLAGVGRGIDMAVASANYIARGSVPVVANGLGNTSTSGTWTVVVMVAGGSGSGYILSRGNDFALIHNFVAGKVEFFAIGFGGTDPRTGSQINLSDSDTTTVHQIAYRYDNGNWCGILDGVEVFNVARSFTTAITNGTLYLGSDGAASHANRKFYDMQTYAHAVSTADLAAMWAARNA